LLPTTLADIETLYSAKGDRQYSGERVTQLEHALQTALLAEQSGASSEMITAALLHDIGHMENDEGETPTLRGVDDRHQFHAISVLKGRFGPTVLTPIRLHVDAKRYLCATEQAYCRSLSVDSKRSLELQGGSFDATAAAEFMGQQFAPDAVNLRRWDDRAKVNGCRTPVLRHYLDIAASCLSAKSPA
jgi:phosphonate degradation associated HDIG domain protein